MSCTAASQFKDCSQVEPWHRTSPQTRLPYSDASQHFANGYWADSRLLINGHKSTLCESIYMHGVDVPCAERATLQPKIDCHKWCLNAVHPILMDQQLGCFSFNTSKTVCVSPSPAGQLTSRTIPSLFNSKLRVDFTLPWLISLETVLLTCRSHLCKFPSSISLAVRCTCLLSVVGWCCHFSTKASNFQVTECRFGMCK